MHACHSILSVFFLFLFSLRFGTLILFPHSFLSSLKLARVVVLWFFSRGYYRCVLFLLCTTSAFYILPAVTGFFTILAINHFCLVRVSLPTTHWFVSYPATTTYLCWLCHSPLPDKEGYFVCFLTMAFSLATPQWCVPSGSSLSFLLLGGMSSQQDITLKRIWAGILE